METKERRRPSGTKRRTNSRASAQRAQKARAQKSAPAPDVVYTQPGPFNRDRFFLQLLTVVAVVLAVVFAMSIFFKVDGEKILVSGTNKYSAYDVSKASGIQDGENLLTLREAEISGRIMAELPYVAKVRVGIKLPDTVNIEIEETEVVYSLEAVDGSWWLIRADGKVMEKTNPADAQQHTVVTGVRLEAPKVGRQAVAEEQEPDPTQETDPNAPVVILGSERLETVITILTLLEKNGVIGQVKSLDVSNMNNLEMWYGDRYEVLLGDTEELARKISGVKDVIYYEMEDFASGQLDASYRSIPDTVVYTPFP